MRFLVLAILGACATEHGGGTDIPLYTEVGDIAGVDGEPVVVPARVAVGTGFTVKIMTAGCFRRYGDTEVHGLDVTPHDLRPGSPTEKRDCESDFLMVGHDTTLWIDTPGVQKVRVHVLEHGEPIEIARDVDAQP